MSANVFRQYEKQIYKYKFLGQIKVDQLMGGTPSDQKVAEGWLNAKLGKGKEAMIAESVAEVMASRQMSEADALKEVDNLRHLNGFKRERCDNCPEDMLCSAKHVLHIEGRHLKAGLKEAASAARAVNNLPAKMGATGKGTLAFVAEHVIVVEKILLIGKMVNGKVVDVTEPDGILQSFPKNPITRQTGIQYTEFVNDAIIDFTVVSDYRFSKKDWAAMWLTGGNQGIGASRSQNYGRYNVTRWEQIDIPAGDTGEDESETE